MEKGDARTEGAESTMAVTLLDHVQHWLCGLQGHDSLMQFERNRVFLKCMSCGHESAGWTVTTARPTLRFSDEPRRTVLPPAQLARARRVA